jgi:crossover junction endodeoxyribonuclease RusA
MTWHVQIDFPDPAPRLNLNDRLFWATRARYTKAWRHAAFIHGRAHRITRLHPANVQLILGVRDPQRRRDPSNWMPTAKACVDGLTDAGYWGDDDSTHVTVLEPVFTKGTGTRIDITPRETPS